MRTRFGGSLLSYSVAIGWPIAHSLIIFVGYVALHKLAPIGSEPAVFAFTGLLPFILCMYPARMIASGLLQHKALLQIPIIKPIHILVTRAILETVNCVVVLLLFIVMFYIIDIHFDPVDFYSMVCAVAASVYLGVGMGFFGAIGIATIGTFFYLILVLSIVGLYLASGAFIPLTIISSELLYYDSYNPLFQCVEWMRSAYFGTGSIYLDKTYVVICASVLLLFGLLGERYSRGLLIQN